MQAVCRATRATGIEMNGDAYVWLSAGIISQTRPSKYGRPEEVKSLFVKRFHA